MSRIRKIGNVDSRVPEVVIEDDIVQIVGNELLQISKDGVEKFAVVGSRIGIVQRKVVSVDDDSSLLWGGTKVRNLKLDLPRFYTAATRARCSSLLLLGVEQLQFVDLEQQILTTVLDKLEIAGGQGQFETLKWKDNVACLFRYGVTVLRDLQPVHIDTEVPFEFCEITPDGSVILATPDGQFECHDSVGHKKSLPSLNGDIYYLGQCRSLTIAIIQDANTVIGSRLSNEWCSAEITEGTFAWACEIETHFAIAIGMFDGRVIYWNLKEMTYSVLCQLPHVIVELAWCDARSELVACTKDGDVWTISMGERLQNAGGEPHTVC